MNDEPMTATEVLRRQRETATKLNDIYTKMLVELQAQLRVYYGQQK